MITDDPPSHQFYDPSMMMISWSPHKWDLEMSDPPKK